MTGLNIEQQVVTDHSEMSSENTDGGHDRSHEGHAGGSSILSITITPHAIPRKMLQLWAGWTFCKALPQGTGGKLAAITARSQTVEAESTAISQRRLRGQCPESRMEVEGKQVVAVIDTGSEVSTVTEAWFNEHLRGLPLQQTHWLSLKAANGLDIPYVGLLEGRVRMFGQECHASILVIKDTACPLTQARRRRTPALLGMNILQQVLPASQKTPQGLPPPLVEAFFFC